MASSFGTRLDTRLGTQLGTPLGGDGGGAYVPTGYLLDDMAADGAGAPRWACWIGGCLRNAYAGPLFRVRRDGGSAGELDIGRDATFPMLYDAAALAAFCAGVNGFVVTAYDQTGNAQHFAQVGAAQPKIWDSVGGLVTSDTVSGAEPALLFSGAQRLTRSAHGFSGSGAVTVAITIDDDRASGATTTIVPWSLGSYQQAGTYSYWLFNGDTVIAFMGSSVQTRWNPLAGKLGLYPHVLRIPANGTRSTQVLWQAGEVDSSIALTVGSDAETLALVDTNYAVWGNGTDTGATSVALTGRSSFLAAWPENLTGSALTTLNTWLVEHSAQIDADLLPAGQSNADLYTYRDFTHQDLPSNFLFGKVAQSGSALSQWVRGTANYIRLRDRILAVPLDREPEVWWIQGETDAATAPLAAAYSATFLDIWADLEADTGRAIKLIDTYLHTDNAGVGGFPFWAEVNAQKDLIQAALAGRCAIIDPTPNGSTTDNVHWSAALRTAMRPVAYAAAQGLL